MSKKTIPPTFEKINKAISKVAKKWKDLYRSGQSINSWSMEVIKILGYSTAEYDLYREVRALVEPALRATKYLTATNVCGSTAFTVKPGANF